MIAHVAGVPFEETIPQLTPLVVGAALALRLWKERARSLARSLDPRDADGSPASSGTEQSEA